MGFDDRHYQQQQPYQGGGGGYGGFAQGMGLPRPTPVVKYLLIINFAVYVLQLVTPPGTIESLFAAKGGSVFEAIQLWRIITFQFLHDTHSLLHIIFNMLGVYFLGPTLERNWGSQRFLTFYLTCGAVGGAIYVIAGSLGLVGGGTLVGASGGVLGLLVACAILFPQFVVFLFIFPVPIRFAAVLFTILYLLNVLRGGPNAGGDICHLGGMATGFLWIMGRPYFSNLQAKKEQMSFQRKQQSEEAQQYEVDRILAKVHEKGIHSLTRKERQVLQKATDQQQRTGS